MVSFKAAAAGGRGVIASIPNLQHGPSAGQFIISNYDPSLIYTVTAGTVSGSTITVVTNTTVQSSIVAYTQKGVIASSARTFERRTPTQSYVQVGTAPGSCGYVPVGQGGCNTVSFCEGGICYCIQCWGGGPIYGYVPDPVPSDFTESYGEWWKIV